MIYDEFQRRAIEHIKANNSVIVSAPTGAGKTVIAEYVINDSLAKGRHVIYTAPIKALSNQKYRDFRKIYGEKIGILTGDVSINPAAPVLIMTTEIFRNKILDEADSLSHYAWIIFDEIHYLDDYERGTVWEESLIFLPPHMEMLALSATIPNIDEFAAWIQSIHNKPVKVVCENKRPVPLHFYYQFQGKILDRFRDIKTSYKIGKRDRYRRGGRGRTGYAGGLKASPNKPKNLIKHLSSYNRLPCIYFCFARKRCEYLAGEIAEYNFLSADEQKRVGALCKGLSEKYNLEKDRRSSDILELAEKGIAYHHAGMLPTLKELVEQLFTSRLIKVIFTTETFALGINMPARTVVFDELRKYYGRFFGALKTRDFYQMAGRAGRRGTDHEGFVYSRVNPRYTSYEELENVVFGRNELVKSRFNASYATILNLYDKYREKLYDIYPSSFHYYQRKERYRKRALELMSSKVDILKQMGHIKEGVLTPKGRFAAKIYGYELSLSEIYEEGLLENLSPTELCLLALGLVFEPRKGSGKQRLSKSARRLAAGTERLVKRIQAKEKKLGIRPLSKEYHYHLSSCLETWMAGTAFEDTLKHTDADEGEVIRYFRMAVQILREILDTPVAAPLKENIRTAIRLVNRDVVDAEKQLRS